MFKNVGSKMQTIAKVFFGIGVIIAVLGGVVVTVAAVGATASTGSLAALLIGLSVGVGVILLGILSAWMSVLFYFAFGKITECVEKETYIMEKMAEKMGIDLEQYQYELEKDDDE